MTTVSGGFHRQIVRALAPSIFDAVSPAARWAGWLIGDAPVAGESSVIISFGEPSMLDAAMMLLATLDMNRPATFVGPLRACGLAWADDALSVRFVQMMSPPSPIRSARGVMYRPADPSVEPVIEISPTPDDWDQLEPDAIRAVLARETLVAARRLLT